MLSWISYVFVIDKQGDSDRRSWATFQEHLAKAPEQVLRWLDTSRLENNKFVDVYHIKMWSVDPSAHDNYVWEMQHS